MTITPFTTITGPAAALSRPNIDTDVIMPKQFLKGIDRAGLGEGAFYDLRYLSSGRPNPQFILNQPEWQATRFLIVGPNFGCGSSREHAVWGLAQLGICALIGTTFAGIFFDNCARNGILAITLPAADIDRLMALASARTTNILTVDLPDQAITSESAKARFPFEIEARRKSVLLRGLDAVGWALEQAPVIRSFEASRFAEEPWLDSARLDG